MLFQGLGKWISISLFLFPGQGEISVPRFFIPQGWELQTDQEERKGMSAGLATDVHVCGHVSGHSLQGWGMATNSLPQIPALGPITVISGLLHKSIRAPGKPDEPGWCQRVNIQQVNKHRHQIQQGAQRQMTLDGAGRGGMWLTSSGTLGLAEVPKSMWKSEAFGSAYTSINPQCGHRTISSFSSLHFPKCKTGDGINNQEFCTCSENYDGTQYRGYEL